MNWNKEGLPECRFPTLLSASLSQFLFKVLILVSEEKFPSFYFKYHRKSNFDSSRLHGCDARRRDKEASKGSLCLCGGVQSG